MSELELTAPRQNNTAQHHGDSALRTVAKLESRRGLLVTITSSNYMSRISRIVVMLSITFMAGAASADDSAGAREHFLNGKKAFELGQFDEAISEYSAAYRLRDDPALLYNLGQAHRLAGHPTDAVHFYRVYLSRVPDASNRNEVTAKIAQLEKLIEEQKKAANLEPNVVKSLTAVDPPTPAQQAAPPPRPSWSERHPGGLMTIFGGGLAAVGVGLLIGGIFEGVAAKSASDDLTKLSNTMGTFEPSKQSAGKSAQLVEVVLLGAGGAVAAAGGGLLFLGQRKARKARAQERGGEPSALIVPVLSPTSAGASLMLRF